MSKQFNDTILKAYRGEKVDYTPAWYMRQAGHYLKLHIDQKHVLM